MKKNNPWKLLILTLFNFLVWTAAGFMIFALHGIADYAGPDGQISFEIKQRAVRRGELIWIGATAFGLLGFVLVFLRKKFPRLIDILLRIHVSLSILPLFAFILLAFSNILMTGSDIIGWLLIAFFLAGWLVLSWKILARKNQSELV